MNWNPVYMGIGVESKEEIIQLVILHSGFESIKFRMKSVKKTGTSLTQYSSDSGDG